MKNITNTLDEIRVGDRVRLVLDAVPLWKVPEQIFETTATSENIAELIEDLDKNVEHGNGTVYLLLKPQKDVLPDGRVLHSPPVHRGFR